jgi:hypothetical protein
VTKNEKLQDGEDVKLCIVTMPTGVKLRKIHQAELEIQQVHKTKTMKSALPM